MSEPSTIKWGLDIKKLPAAVQASSEPIVRFFSYHDAHPVALTMVLMEKFGFDWVEWEAETLKPCILREFKATSISEHNWQKLQAVRVLMQTVGFWKEWHIFEKIIQAFNNNVPRFDISQRCTVAQLMAGVDIANQIREEPLEDEVQRYIAACALDNGIVYLPEPLTAAQRVLSQPMYRCKVCGNIDPDDSDGRCDYCSARFQDEHPLNFKPSPHVPDDAGTDLERFLARDPEKFKRCFDEILVKGVDNVTVSDESMEDVHSVKLVVANEYMQLRRRQLVEQLEELKSWVSH